MADHQYASKRGWRVSETLLISVLLLALLCFYFWRVILGGFTLTPADMIFDFSFFKEAAPSGFQHASNALLSDVVLKFYPWHTVAREVLQNGQVPFWNPYIYCGTPLFANAESAVLYPVNLLGYLLPLNTALAFSAILRMFIAGLGTFLFLRALKVGRFGAVIGAVTFMFGGSMTVWLNYPVGNAYAWMPMLFFLGERILVSRNLLYLPLTSTVIAVQILGGHYPTSFTMLVVWWLYCMYRMVDAFQDNGDRRQALGAFLLLAGAVVVGSMLVAVHLIPFWEWLQHTNEAQMRLEERSSLWIAPSFWKGVVVTLVTLVLPNFFGNPTWGSPMSFFYSNYIEQMVYMGIVPLALAILAVLGVICKIGLAPEQPIEWNGRLLPKKGWILFLAGLGVLFLGMALRLPGIDLINHLPVLNVVASSRHRLVFTFCVAVLAGIGAERIFHLPLDAPVFRYLVWGLLSFGGMGTTLLIIVRWVLVGFKDALITYNRIRGLYPIMVEAFSLSNVSMYSSILVALLFAGVITLYGRKVISSQLSMVLSLGLVLIDLFVFGMNFNPVIPQDQVFPRTESVQFLQKRLADQEPVRIVAMNDDLPPNTGTPYHFYEIAGSDFPSRRYTELVQALGGKLYGHNRIVFSTFQPQLIKLTNVKYIIASVEPEGLPRGQLKEVYRNSSVRVYEYLSYLPRAYVVHQVKTVNEDAQILEMLTLSTFDPSSQIIIEEPPPARLPRNASSLNDQVQIVQYQPQQVSIQVELAENGFLFLSDAYYPGWQAFVNGEESKIYRANYAFRAIHLLKGKHLVEFVYTPTGFKLGLAITLTGLTLTLIILGVVWKKQTQRSLLQRDS